MRLGLVAQYDAPTAPLPSLSNPVNNNYGSPLSTPSFPQTPQTLSPALSPVISQQPISLPILPPISQPIVSQPYSSPLSTPYSQSLGTPLVPAIPQPMSRPLAQQAMPLQIPIVPSSVPQQTPQRQPRQGLINFRPEDLQREFPHIAKGSFGVVFKGHAKGFSEVVVIKDLEIQSSKSVDEWRKEISLMRYDSMESPAHVIVPSNPLSS